MENNEIIVHQGTLEDYLGNSNNKIDSIVVSSNAFGLMDHGFDRSICNILGNNIETQLRKKIIEQYNGEQPVGTTIILPINGDKNVKYIINSPTRRVNYSIKGTDNVYLSMKSLCNSIKHWNINNNDDDNKKIHKVLCTGFGCFYGGINPKESARQTILAWLFSRLNKPNYNDISWEYAETIQSYVKCGSFYSVLDYVIQNPNSLNQNYRSKLKQALFDSSNQSNIKRNSKTCIIM